MTLTRNLTDFLIDIIAMDYIVEFYNCNRELFCTWKVQIVNPLQTIKVLVFRRMQEYKIKGYARIICIEGTERMSIIVLR